MRNARTQLQAILDLLRIRGRIGAVPDTLMAEALGCSARKVGQLRLGHGSDRWLRRAVGRFLALADLGEVRDSIIADRLGVAYNTVRYVRHQHGIDSHRDGTIKARLLADEDLGRISDAGMARRHDCGLATVTRARNAAGIPPAFKRVGGR